MTDFNSLLLSNDADRIDIACSHQLQKMWNVMAMIAIAHAYRQVLVHSGADGKEVIVRCVYADNGKRPGLGHYIDGPTLDLGRRPN